MTTPTTDTAGLVERYWSVTVRLNGDEIVTIEPRMLAGKELGPREETAIRTAAEHLLSFIGDRAIPERLTAPVEDREIAEIAKRHFDDSAVDIDERGYSLSVIAQTHRDRGILLSRIHQLEAEVKEAREKALRDALNEIPGGNICDPQEIADRIRSLKAQETDKR